MSNVEKFKKVTKSMRLVKRVRNGFESCVVAVELTDGRILDARVKDYDLASIVDDVNKLDVKIDFETRHSADSDVDYDCIVVKVPSIELECLAFLSKTQVAIMNLVALKK